MSPSRIDPERLAALMEGKLSASEAAAVRAELAVSDPETIVAFADAASIGAELGLLPGQPDVKSESRRSATNLRSLGFWSGIALAAAAVVAFVVVSRGERDTAPFSLSGALASIPSSVTAPTSEPWSARRGAVDDMSNNARAARLGILLIDFELAARTGDTAGVRRSASSIVALADGIPGTAGVITPYRAFANGTEFPGLVDSARASASATLGRLAGPSYLKAGAAAEGLRAAILSGDSSAVFAACDNAANLRRTFSITMSAPEASARDSLVRALAQKPCDVGRIRAFSSAFIASLAR